MSSERETERGDKEKKVGERDSKSEKVRGRERGGE